MIFAVLALIYDDIWWYFMIFDDIWWFLMIFDDICCPGWQKVWHREIDLGGERENSGTPLTTFTRCWVSGGSKNRWCDAGMRMLMNVDGGWWLVDGEWWMGKGEWWIMNDDWWMKRMKRMDGRTSNTLELEELGGFVILCYKYVISCWVVLY